VLMSNPKATFDFLGLICYPLKSHLFLALRPA
jgi:hypothetical protein